jgi:hypothetical protein
LRWQNMEMVITDNHSLRLAAGGRRRSHRKLSCMTDGGASISTGARTTIPAVRRRASAGESACEQPGGCATAGGLGVEQLAWSERLRSSRA